jgi:hypothetical protein
MSAQANDFNRGARAWDVYKAIDGSQYTPEKRKVFQEEDRHPWQFDFASAKVDTLAGTIVSELPDPEWSPVNGQKNTVTEAIRECYYIDKELFNFPFVMLQTIRDGCVHGGWCEIGESKKYHPAGNVSLTHIRSGYLIPDPYWLSYDDREMMRAKKIGYFSAESMKRIWKKKSEQIDKAIWEFKKGLRKQIPENPEEKQRLLEGNVGDEWKVVESHYIDIVQKTRLIGMQTGANTLTSQLVWIPFPATDDRDYLESFAKANDIDWESVQEVPFEERIHKVETFTELADDILLEDGKSRVQCNGLPFFHYSTNRVDGHDKGVAETIADLQMMFNERMSHVHELIAKASGGAEIWNEDIFRDAKQKQRFAKMKNKPGHTEFAALDDVKNIKEDVGHIDVNPAIFQQVSVIYNEMLPLISRVSDSMSAIGASEDTGVLFEKKYQMNRIANVMFDKFAKQFVNNIGEGYFYQWQNTYADVEREIKTRRGESKVLNQKATRNGMPVIVNSVANAPRCRVIVNENTQSSTFQMRQRTLIRDIIKSIPPDDYLRMDAVLGSYFDSIDLPEKDKAMMEMVTEMNSMKAKMRFMTELSTMKANMANSEMMVAQTENMMKQMQAPQPQQQQVPEQFTPEQQATPVQPQTPQQQPAPEMAMA